MYVCALIFLFPAFVCVLLLLVTGLVEKHITVGQLWQAIHRLPRDGGPEVLDNILALVGSQFGVTLPILGDELPDLLPEPSYEDKKGDRD